MARSDGDVSVILSAVFGAVVLIVLAVVMRMVLQRFWVQFQVVEGC